MATPRNDTAQQLARGVGWLLTHLGYHSLTEFTLGSGWRADLASLDRKGHITIVEIKSSVVDFCADQKWREYLDCCDFFLCGAAGFFRRIFPDDPGFIIADAYSADIACPAPANLNSLHASRRREVTLRFGRAAAKRLRALEDPRP